MRVRCWTGYCFWKIQPPFLFVTAHIQPIAIQSDSLHNCSSNTMSLLQQLSQHIPLLCVHFREQCFFPLCEYFCLRDSVIFHIDPVNFPESAYVADRNRADAIEGKVMHPEVSSCLRKMAQITQSGLLAIRLRLSLANHSHPPLDLDARVALILCDQADARVMPDVFGVFGEGADENQEAAIVIYQIRRDRTERVAVEFFRQGAQRAVAMSAQHQACFAGIAHAESFNAVCAKRRPNAMHSFFSVSLIAWSLAIPATWLAP